MSSAAEIKAGLSELKSKRESLSKQIADFSTNLFNNHVQELFVQHPILEGFRWTQYTPYFNDGDECTFSTHADDPYVKFKGVDPTDEDEVDDDDYVQPYFPKTKQVPTGNKIVSTHRWDNGKLVDEYKTVSVEYGPKVEIQKAALEAIREFMGNFSEDDLRSMFGDHQQITVTAKGVEVEEYEHD